MARFRAAGQSFDPASGQPIGTYADGGRAEADAAIAAAVRAFEDGPWKDDHALRATALEEIAAAFERHADALIDLLALENGKIKPEAAFEVGMVPGKLRYYAGLARSERAPAARRAPTWCRWCCASRWASPASSCRGIHRWC